MADFFSRPRHPSIADLLRMELSSLVG
jgi:hypothetical protein